MIHITEAAQRYINHLLADEDRQGLALYLAITGRRRDEKQISAALLRC
jgi:Fe-S cluster assembly iron-binding protein IscA